jgi:hypothetical protein
MKCKECGDSLGGSLDYDHFCFRCVNLLMSEYINMGTESPNYEEASGEYYRKLFDQWAQETPPFWKTPIDPA